MIRSLSRILLAIVVLAAILAGGGWLLIRSVSDPDPLYAGQPLAYWLKQLNSPAPDASNQVTHVLNSEILPRLSRTLTSDMGDSALKPVLIKQLNQLPGVDIQFLPADGRRAGAATLLGQIGPAASQTIPVLLKSSKHDPDGGVRAAAGRALSQVCRDPAVAVPVLISSLENSNAKDGSAETAINLLGGFGPASKAAVPKLLALINGPDASLQGPARRALQKIAPEAGGAVESSGPATPLPKPPKS